MNGAIFWGLFWAAWAVLGHFGPTFSPQIARLQFCMDVAVGEGVAIFVRVELTPSLRKLVKMYCTWVTAERQNPCKAPWEGRPNCTLRRCGAGSETPTGCGPPVSVWARTPQWAPCGLGGSFFHSRRPLPAAKFLAKRPPSQLPENEEQRRRRRKERFEKPASRVAGAGHPQGFLSLSAWCRLAQWVPSHKNNNSGFIGLNPDRHVFVNLTFCVKATSSLFLCCTHIINSKPINVFIPRNLSTKNASERV